MSIIICHPEFIGTHIVVITNYFLFLHINFLLRANEYNYMSPFK